MSAGQLSPSAVNETRAQYTRSRLGAPANDLAGPAVNISGLANFGVSTTSPTARDLDLFELANVTTLQTGAHAVKAGVDFILNRVTITFPGALQGAYTFSSLGNLQASRYVTYQQAFGTVFVKPLNHLQMAIPCCPVHGIARASFGSVFVKPLNHFQMAVLCCPIHGVGRAAYGTVLVQKLNHLQMAILCCPVHGIARASYGSVFMKPLHHFQMASLCCTVHGIGGAAYVRVLV